MSHPGPSPRKVAILMGSESDRSVMSAAESVLAHFKVPFETHVLSAHRTPEAAAQFAKSAAERGFAVVIAGAGMAAHLPGVVAAHTTLPVIGVPLDASPLHGVDALYSIVQMPKGVPVASVGIGAAANAALLAVQILAISDAELTRALAEFRQAGSVLPK
ncbi:MAG: 5-(carboxyamino)imidazole ribonucleotide mutase [bacterium]|nr:5-(carboxyamino)imidazole ribonucleotide mutase [candidate division KSB1 bacterium]MDH7558761.1 5-(carboxyamino)imidazole ribonucleotide mutase [bacterium]